MAFVVPICHTQIQIFQWRNHHGDAQSTGLSIQVIGKKGNRQVLAATEVVKQERPEPRGNGVRLEYPCLASFHIALFALRGCS